MPKKRICKTPFIVSGILAVLLSVSLFTLWSFFGNVEKSLTAAADISLSQIEYITVRYQGPSGASQVKKITEADAISRIYDSLSRTRVKKRVRFGSGQSSAKNSIYLKLKSSETVCISDTGNKFKTQNSGPLSAFFVCYYDVENVLEFSKVLSTFTA